MDSSHHHFNVNNAPSPDMAVKEVPSLKDQEGKDSETKKAEGKEILLPTKKDRVIEKRHVHSGGDGDSTEGMKVELDSKIGLALVLGFVFMLIVEEVSKLGTGRGRDVESGSVQPRYKMTATIGLVVHAAADGIALGAASTTAHSDVQLIVFLAIMLHKAPAAFGLVTFLLHEGLDKARVRRHLLVFALAAPVAAVLTWAGISQGGGGALSSLSTTGILMLFSAGTFLYVATVHVLPELQAGGHSHSAPGSSSSPSSSSGGGGPSSFQLREVAAIAIGALLPSLLTFGHSH